ncbi:MAG: M28 family metallopeptidase, partial [Gemmatimonadaceae bacterium]
MKAVRGLSLTVAMFACVPLPQTGGVLPGSGTSAAITPADLSARLYAFAHDSMAGREAATEGGLKAARYLAAEAARMGLEPAGDGGTFYQLVPLTQRGYDETRQVRVDGQPLTLWAEYLPRDPGTAPRSLDGTSAIYGGNWGDTATLISSAQAAGKVVVIMPAPGVPGVAGLPNRGAVSARYSTAAAIAVGGLEGLPAGVITALRQGQTGLAQAEGSSAQAPLYMYVSAEAARKLLGHNPADIRPGHAGRAVSGHPAFGQNPLRIPTYNVIAKIRGSDPTLAGQFVAFGAHSDHVGTGPAVDHDSLRAHNMVFRRGGAGPATAAVTPAGTQRMRAVLDSLRAIRPMRLDSIFNGADDDASGSVGLLEIAEAFAAQPVKPKRSLIFVWHMAEEMGLVGADWFTKNPTVPLDSIITAIVVDMIGRGTAQDAPNGGPNYLQVLGTGRRSTELDATVKAVAARPEFTWDLDYSFDAPGHPEQFFCRSDHYMYARFGIPVAFLHTGSHVDYHMVTDEAQYIDYSKLSKVTNYMKVLGETIANRDRPFVLDKPAPNPD